MKFYLLGLVIVFFMSSCVKDKPQDPSLSGISISSNNSVLVINEGNYGWGNSSISLYDPTSNSVLTDYYKQQNNNLSLGDVCQSITKYNNAYYVVVNNSNKIEVLNAFNFKKTATINGLNSPRYFLPVTYNKAYVSDLYANAIQIVDMNSNAISGSIPCMKGTEQMVLIYNKAFITNINSNYCYVVNTATDELTDSIYVGKNASSIVIDKNSKIWTLSKGSVSPSILGSLKRINPITLAVEQNLVFNSTDSPWRLCYNKTRDTLYYLNNGVFKFAIDNIQLPVNPIVSQGSKLFYGLGVNFKDYTIYVSDAVDYVQKSKIEIYNSNGALIQKFNSGFISNGFMFE